MTDLLVEIFIFFQLSTHDVIQNTDIKPLNPTVFPKYSLAITSEL